MFRKLLCLAMTVVLLLACLASCSDDSGKIMQMGDVSIDGIDFSADGKGFVADSDYISENVFRYFYIFLKESMLANFKQYESYGYTVSGDVPVGDTEAFWNCMYSKDENGNEVTFGRYLYDSAISLFEDVLALEAAAEEYGYKLPETYDEDFAKYVAERIVATGSDYLQNVTEVADEDGNLFGWVKDRWAMQLMSEGISTDAWERVFYLYSNVIVKDITTQLADNGVIKAEDDSVLTERGEKELKEKLDTFMKSNMKVKYIAYLLKVEEDGDNASKDTKIAESSEISEHLSSDDVTSDDADSNDASTEDASSDDVSSDDTSSDISDDLSPKEFNEQLREKCKRIYNGLLDGSLNIDDEIKKCDISEKLADYPDGLVGSFDDLKQSFGESVEELKVGDIKMYEHGGVIHIIQVQELTEKDSGISTELTEDDLAALRAQSVSAELEKLLDKYKAAIIFDDALLEKYNSPWTIN